MHNRRIWIERMVESLSGVLENARGQRELTPVRESCCRLQQYCNDQFPNYLEDMLKDVKIIQKLREENTESSGKGLVHRVLEELRLDCTNYAAIQSLKITKPRTEQMEHV